MAVRRMSTSVSVPSTDSESEKSSYPVRAKKLKTNHRYCPHCDQTLSYKTYRTHKRLHYNPSGVWSTGTQETSELSSSESLPDPIPYDDFETMCTDLPESPPQLQHGVGSFGSDSTDSEPGDKLIPQTEFLFGSRLIHVGVCLQIS